MGSENNKSGTGCAFYGISHLFPKEVDLKSNVTEEEDDEGDGDPDQVDDRARGEAHGVPTAGHLMRTHLKMHSGEKSKVHLTDAHHRVPAKASEAELANGELKDGRADDEERENPDQDTAYQGRLGV